VTAPSDGAFPELATDIPTPARMYDYTLGGKDNYEVDRAAVLGAMPHFPEGVDNARDNRLFLYRAVRYLARDAGIRQFLDLGSGLPTADNVHQVAQQFQPDAHVVYVDNDPTVLTHGRALLTKDQGTTVLAADMIEPEKILSHADTRRLLDFSAPVAVLFLSVGHSIDDDATVRRMLATVREEVVAGSYLAYTQMTSLDPALAEQGRALARSHGYTFHVRTQAEVVELLADPQLEPVEPGLVDVREWRPDPDQPPLPQVDEPLRPYLGASRTMEYRGGEFGGVLRVTAG
jgi:nucleotide-binding universal stress UspA family protein